MLLIASLYVGIFAVFFLYGYHRLDPDFGWHLMSGLYFLEHGIPATDIFTYTASNFPWVNHEWLSDMLLALLFAWGGYGLLAAVYAGMWTLSVAILGKGVHPIIVITATIALLPFSGVRALTWTIIGLSLLILILRQKDTRWRFLIPPLFLLWANVHGSFLVGVLYGAFVVLKERSLKLLLIGLVSLVATLCNPYGFELYTEIFRTMFDGELGRQVAEWQSFALPIYAIPYILLYVGFVIYQERGAWRKYIRFETVLLLGSVLSLRMLPLFIVTSMNHLQQAIDEIARSIPRTLDPHRKALIGTVVYMPIIATIGLFAGDHIVRQTELGYPVQAVSYLNDNPCAGNVFNSYNYGGYLIWQLPSHKVYIDGRMPSWERGDTKYMNDYEQVITNKEFREKEFARHNISCVLMESHSPLVGQLKKEGWHARVEGNGSVLLLQD